MISHGDQMLCVDKMYSFEIDRDLFELMWKAIGGGFLDGAGFH